MFVSAFVVSFFALAVPQSPPAAPTPPAQTLVYPPSDPAKDIAAALTAAKADGKHVLLDFGADWCPDCRVLGKLFEDPAVAPFVAANFHVVHIDVGRRDKNGDVVAQYGATSGAWIPAVVVLDHSGKSVGVTDETVRLTRRDTPQTLLPMLQAWAPKKLVSALATFTAWGVDVSVSLEEDGLGALWLASTFTPGDARVHLYAAQLPDDGVDGLGRPTRVMLGDDAPLVAVGAPIATRPVLADRIDALGLTVPIYPDGPVTLLQRVTRRATSSAGAARVTYMGCSPMGCLPPVEGRRIVIAAPQVRAPR